MTRRIGIKVPLTCALFLLACGQPAQTRLPDEVGEWKLAASQPIADIPPVARDLAVRSATSGVYRGPAEIRLSLFEMTTDAGAFELRQKWPPSKAQAIHTGRCFLAAEGDVDPVALTAFLGDLEKRLSCGAVK